MIFLVVLHVLVTIAMIVAILLQKGETSSLTGGSQNQALFTARGSTNFLTRGTAILATIFITNCILMTMLSSYYANKSVQVLTNITKEQDKEKAQ